VYDAGIWPGGHRPIKASSIYFGGSNPEPILFIYKIKTTRATMAKTHSFFIYLLPRKKTLDVLNGELEGPGWRAHP